MKGVAEAETGGVRDLFLRLQLFKILLRVSFEIGCGNIVGRHKPLTTGKTGCPVTYYNSFAEYTPMNSYNRTMAMKRQSKLPD